VPKNIVVHEQNEYKLMQVTAQKNMNVSCLCTSLHLLVTNDIGGAAGFIFLFQLELALPKFTYVISLLVTVL